LAFWGCKLDGHGTLYTWFGLICLCAIPSKVLVAVLV